MEVRQPDGALGGHPAVACGASLRDRFRQHRFRAIPLPGLEQRSPERRQEAQATGIAGRAEGDRALEEIGRRSHIASGNGLRSRSRQPLGGTLGRLPRGLARGTELGAVAIGLLEVIADDFVQLDEIGSALGDPGGEALVQVGPGRLRERLIGGVADQEMAEAKGVFAGKLRPVRAKQLPPDERRREAPAAGHRRRERLDGTAVKDAPLDGAALEHVPLDGVELIESRGEQRLDRRRHGDRRIRRLAHERDHLLDEERISLCRVEDPRAQHVSAGAAVEQACDERVGVGGRERLEQHRRRVELAAAPVRPAVEQLGPRHAEQQDRRIAAEVGDVINEIEERFLAPVDVVEHDDERRVRGDGLQQHPHRPRDLLDRGHEAALAENRPNRARGGRIEPEAASRGLRLGAEQLLEHLHDRPVGDPVPVGEAAAPDDRAPSSPSRNSWARRDFPTPAAPSTVNSWHERFSSASPTRLAGAAARAPGRPSRPCERRDGGSRRYGHEPVSRDRCRLALQRRAARAASTIDRVARRAARVSAPIRISPGRAACSSRAVTLTASPVASRSCVPVTTSPVLTPIRSSSDVPYSRSSSSFSSARPSRSSAAARTARSASSSCSDRDAEHRHHGIADELLDRRRRDARRRAAPSRSTAP